jgi:peptide/nickel transport system substrate-binding protein
MTTAVTTTLAFRDSLGSAGLSAREGAGENMGRQGSTARGRLPGSARPRWSSRFSQAVSLTVLASLLLACAPPTPPAATSAPPAATSAPAAATAPPATSAAAKPAAQATQPAPAAQPAAPAAQPAASPAAATSQPAAQAAARPSGSIVIVNESEPNTLTPKDVSSYLAYFVMNNIYDHLTARDLSSDTPKVVGQLAESFSPVDPKTWRFKLRQGIKFTNGEPFNADAVVVAVQDLANPEKPGGGAPEYGTLESAQKIDDFTVDVRTKDPDPILPERLINFPIAAPNWVRTAPPEVLATQAVGSGPYLLAEYVKGQYLLFKANENYWGPVKPKIAEVKLIGRGEQTVRGAMVRTGEADLVFQLAPDQSQQAPQTLIEEPQDAAIVRINHEHPVLKNVRVRQAIAEGIDTQGIINAFFPGVGHQLNGQILRKGSVGWNPELKPYPYRPDESRKALQEAGALGTAIEYVNRPSQHVRAGEVGEAVVNQLNQIGFNATLRNLDAIAAQEAIRSVRPDQKRTDLQLTSISYRILDSSRPWDSYYACGGTQRIGCDVEWDRRYTEAKAFTGEARDKAFQALWAYAYDEYWYLPLFALSRVHGASTRLQWTPRLDGQVLFVEMALKP